MGGPVEIVNRGNPRPAKLAREVGDLGGESRAGSEREEEKGEDAAEHAMGSAPAGWRSEDPAGMALKETKHEDESLAKGDGAVCPGELAVERKIIQFGSSARGKSCPRSAFRLRRL
jgi:hypothetical protein